MIAPEQLASAYGKLVTALRSTYTIAKVTLQSYCDTHHFPISGRIKTVDSVAEKIESGYYSCLEDLDDLVGFTVVVPNKNHVPHVVEHCRKVFDVVRIKEKSDYQRPPEAFWFDFLRIQAVIQPPPEGLSVEPSLDITPKHVPFEIQIRTAFEHAWSTATHSLAYKTGKIDWKRLRLAWQLKATVEMLDASVGAYEALSEQSSAASWPAITEKVLLAQHIEDFFSAGLLPEELRPKDMSRVCDNIALFVDSIDPPQSLNVCIPIFMGFIEASDPATIPRTITLYQLFVAALCSSDLPIFSNSRPCHITDDLKLFFPSVRKIKPVFRY